MARSRGLDLSPLIKLMKKTPAAAARGADRALSDIKDDWVRESRDVAPLDTGNLRREITGKVEGKGLTSYVVVRANANSNSGRRFNYAYYIHEGHMAEDGKRLRHAGTEEEFIDKPADDNTDRWLKMAEKEIKDEMKGAGW